MATVVKKGKAKLLVYFYQAEITTESNTSVVRLVASLMEALQDRVDVVYFSFYNRIDDKAHYAKPAILKVPNLVRLFRKLNNVCGLKRIHWFDLKRKAAEKYFKGKNQEFEYVLVLGLDDVGRLRKISPEIQIIYWIHNISALCNKEFISYINKANYFVSPSNTTYHLLVQLLQPKPLEVEYYLMPNWPESVFSTPNPNLAKALAEKYQIKSDTICFIHSGGDLKLKGKFIAERTIKHLTKINRDIVFFFAGGKDHDIQQISGNVKLIYLGLVNPSLLAAYYQICHFGIFSSLAYDHCPLTLLEMISCDVLPIASQIGGVPEILGEKYPFLIQEPHAVASWVSMIEKAINSDPTILQNTAAALKTKIGANYNRQKAASIMMSILEN